VGTALPLTATFVAGDWPVLTENPIAPPEAVYHDPALVAYGGRVLIRLIGYD